MKIAAVNSSFYGAKPADRIYNLAVDRIAQYHTTCGDEVIKGQFLPMTMKTCDKFYFSVIFTWDIPRMIDDVLLVKVWGKEVEIGGPAATFMHQYIAKHTGINPHIGLDDRFENLPGEFKMTFTSRGCPNGCKYCGVRLVEPDSFEYGEYSLASMIGDNNILCTSWPHQRNLVDRYRGFKGDVDINSGFDVRFFEQRHYHLYRRLNLKQWRFAFDSLDNWEDVWRVATFMRWAGFDRHHCMFYCLIGFPGTTPEEALFRLNTIRDFGMNPYPMRYIPLNSLSHRYVAPGWTEEILFKMQTYYQSPFIWKACTWEDFVPGKNVVDVAPEQIGMGGVHELGSV